MSKQQEVCLDDEPIYKSAPIVELGREPELEPEPLSNKQPPPLTRSLNIELHTLGTLDLNWCFTKQDSLDNIVEG